MSLVSFLMVVVMIFVTCWNMLRPRDLKLQAEPVVQNIEIELGGASLEEIFSNDKGVTYYDNTLVVYGGDKVKTYEGVQLKGRGNSTWGADKKPFQIKLSNKDGFLGMKPGKKWVLLADFYDPTHLRNETAFYLERVIGEKYPVESRYANLTIDGEAQGLYLVTSKIEIGKNSVDLRDKLGILVELDNLHLDDCTFSVKHTCIVAKDVVAEDDMGLAKDEFMASFNELEGLLDGGEYADIERLIDVDSFAKYYLLSEFTVNPDAYVSSFFMYKDGLEDKIHAGPGWDFDLTFGNQEWWNWVKVEQEFRPNSFLNFHANENTLIGKLLKYPEFRRRAYNIYSETLAKRETEIVEHVRRTAAVIKDDAVIDAGMWERSDYVESVDGLVKWIEGRLAYFRYDFWEQMEAFYDDTIVPETIENVV